MYHWSLVVCALTVLSIVLFITPFIVVSYMYVYLILTPCMLILYRLEKLSDTSRRGSFSGLFRTGSGFRYR